MGRCQMDVGVDCLASRVSDVARIHHHRGYSSWANSSLFWSRYAPSAVQYISQEEPAGSIDIVDHPRMSSQAYYILVTR
jgi:hypothetical protein